MTETLGFIGLGQMGLAIAPNLLAAGFKLRVYNRTQEKAASLLKPGVVRTGSPAEVAVPGGIVLTMVADDRALDAVTTPELVGALGPGGLHISLSTVSPQTSQLLARRHELAGGSLLAAPVFGRPESAAARKLWICASGKPADLQRAKPVFDAISQGVFEFGPEVGAANVVKLAGNFMLTAAIEAMAEASALAEKNGIPRAQLLNMLTSTLFNCPIYTGYGKRLIDADFDKVGFPIPLILKDMHLVQQAAAASRAPMPIVNLLCDRLLRVLAQGKEKLDATAMVLGAAEDAGLKW